MSLKRKKNDSSHSSKSIKPHRVRNYFIMPLIYTAILLVIALPIQLVLKDKIYDSIAQGYKNATTHSFYDEVSIDRKLPLSQNETQEVMYKPIVQNECYGKIMCESAGLNCDVYRGADSKSNLRVGVGSVDALPGGDKPVKVYGYSTKYFKKLSNVKKNDEVIFNTTYGKYTYKVKNIVVAESFDEKSLDNSNSLIMFCSNGSDAFDCKKPEKLYVVAELVSGPRAMEDVK